MNIDRLPDCASLGWMHSFSFLACFALLPSALPAQNPPPDARFTTEVLASGMAQPMELERAPDGRIFVIEIGGKVRIWKPGTQALTDAGKIPVFTEQENGLLGFALDPQFATNDWIYIYYSPQDFVGQRLSRFTMQGDVLDLKSEVVLLKFGTQRRECCHHAGSVEFGPDGCLFISTGDNTHPHGDSEGYAPMDNRKGMEPWDAQKSAANPGDLRGKILRIRPKPDGTYEIPPGNLFAPGTPGTLPEIYCMGCRNPWRMSVDQATGHVYWGEVGPDAGGDGPRGPRGYDEVNQAKQAGNFGWPFFIGNNFAYAHYDYETKKTGEKYDPAHPRNDGVNNTGAKDLPAAVPAFIYYPYGESKEFPSVGSGGRTACAGPVFHFRPEFEKSGGFPPYYDKCLLWWDWERRMVKWARLDKDSNLQEILPFTAVSVKRLLDAVFAPDGTLYCIDYGETWGANADSRLLHVTFNYGNIPPVARAAVDRTSGALPLTLKLSSAGSSDPDGDAAAMKYEWRLGGEVLATGPSAEVSVDRAGDHIIELRVTDVAGGTASAGVAVTAGNSRPDISFESPADGDFYTPGQPVQWKVRVDDAEEGNSAAQPDLFASRVLVSASAARGTAEDPGLALMKRADCFNCHAVEHRIVGPGFLEIAEKYRATADTTLEQSVERVVKGSTGVWGPLPMLPHGHQTREEIRRMVQWVYALKSDAKPLVQRALSGAITVPPDTSADGAFRIHAAFTDIGGPGVSALTGEASVTLRSRRVEAESHDGSQGTQVLGGQTASGQKFVGDTNHGQHIRFSGMNLAAVARITCRISSAGAGGWIEFHAGKPDGPLVAKVKVPVTGGWETWQEVSAEITRPDPARADLFAVFVNPGRGGLMNVDWIQFE